MMFLRWHTLALLAAAILTAVLLHARGQSGLALGWLMLCLIVHVLHHSWHRHVLLRWARNPRQFDLPAGRGIWPEIYALLRHQLREETVERHLAQLDRQQLRLAVDLLPDALIVLDDRKRMHWRNRAAAELFGLPDEALPIDQLIRANDLIRYLNANDFHQPLTLRLPEHPGHVFMLRVRQTPEAWRLLICTDVTERFNMEAMQRDFVANVSHELRTPLTVINGTLETLIDLDLPREQQQKHLNSARRQGDAMFRLANELLTLSALGNASLRRSDEHIDMQAMLEELVTEARGLSAGRQQISLHCEPGIRLYGVDDEIRSAVRNLLTNAIRYTPEGGQIDIQWQMHEHQAALSVTDTGIGIAEEHLPRLGERFYRVDASRSRASGGTGLGLAIVRQVAERHEATFRCTSRPGHGSCFRLLWPADRVRSD